MSDGGRRLFLHVGPHKTGTTSVQQALADHRAALLAGGLDVCQGEGFGANPAQVNAIRLANCFIRPEVMTAPRLRGRYGPPDAEFVAATIALVRAHVLASPVQEFVISSEEFSYLRTVGEAEALRAALVPLFEAIVPVLVLRNEPDWRASRHDQLTKTGLIERIAGLEGQADPNGAWYYDRAALVAFWKGIGPAEVIDYDAAVARDGSILPAVFAALGRVAPGAPGNYWLNSRKIGTKA